MKPVRPDTVARSLAIGSPADGDLAVATATASGGAIHAVAEEAVGEGMALLAETTGVFGETAAGVTLGALREAVAAGGAGPDDRVVLLVTGDGLKTPGAGRRPPEAGADRGRRRRAARPARSGMRHVTLPFRKSLYFLKLTR